MPHYNVLFLCTGNLRQTTHARGRWETSQLSIGEGSTIQECYYPAPYFISYNPYFLQRTVFWDLAKANHPVASRAHTGTCHRIPS